MWSKEKKQSKVDISINREEIVTVMIKIPMEMLCGAKKKEKKSKN